MRWVAYNRLVPDRPAEHPLPTEITFFIGRELHKLVQDSLDAVHGGRREVPWVMGDVAGFADYVYEDEAHGLTAVEIKTMGANSYRYSIEHGPKREHRLQAGLSALALGAQAIRLIYVPKDNRSDDPDILLDWTLPFDDTEARAVRAELEMAVTAAKAGEVPQRWYNGDEILPNPSKWPCRYCPFIERCRLDGPGRTVYSGRGYKRDDPDTPTMD